MDTRAYDIIAQVERTHWWYRGRRRILHAVASQGLRERAALGVPDGAPRGVPTARGLALDLGCGTGANLDVVARCGTPVGCDISDRALAYARARGGYAQLVASDAARLPFAARSFDWLFATDILEHLDDVGAAAEIRRVLRPGGWAVITVPAFRALWGAQDDASHHLRRYTKRGLLDVLRGAGLGIRYVGYINAALLAPIFVARRAIRMLRLDVASENTLHPGWANPILESVFGAEARVVPRIALPFGVSLLCIATAPAGGD